MIMGISLLSIPKSGGKYEPNCLLVYPCPMSGPNPESGPDPESGANSELGPNPELGMNLVTSGSPVGPES